MDAGGPVHRRRRARDPAPDVRALLHQGARRPRPPRLPGAVQRALHPGDGHQGRREDEQVARATSSRRPRSSSASAPTRPAATSSSSVRPSRTRTGRTRAWTACTVSSGGCGGWRRRSPSAAGRVAGRGRALRGAPRATTWRCCARPTGRSRRSAATCAASPSTPPSPPSWSCSTNARGCARRSSCETLRFALATAASLLFPFAPHVCSDIYERLTGERVWEQPWPQADESLLESDVYELVCQVNGKVRDRVQARADAPGGAQGALPGGRPTSAPTSTAARSSRRSSCRASSSTSSSAERGPLSLPPTIPERQARART